MAFGRNKPIYKRGQFAVMPADTPVFMNADLRDAVADRERSVPAPLSPDALSVLVRARENGPVSARNVPATIRDKLVFEGWVRVINADSADSKLAITEKGKARIAFDEQ